MAVPRRLADRRGVAAAGRSLPQSARLALALGGCALVVLGFFVPWAEGTAEFATRDFSGFDFARLVRNFEITADSPSSTGQIRAAAVIFYLVPALAVNAAVLRVGAHVNPYWNRAADVALIAGGSYALAVVAGVLVLSTLPISQLAQVVGMPSYGLALSALGALVGAWLGVGELRQRGNRNWESRAIADKR